MQLMRCFLGCDLTPKAKLSLAEWRHKALRLNGAFQPVKAANFHITTWFIGQVSSTQLDNLVQQIELTLPETGLSCFDLQLDDVISWAKPKIVAAIPLNPPDGLLHLQQFCKRMSDNAKLCAKGNHEVYRPHVTLTRKVRPEQVAPPLFSPNITTHVSHVHLFESVSGHSGVQYIPRFSFPLPGTQSIRERLKKGLNR